MFGTDSYENYTDAVPTKLYAFGHGSTIPYNSSYSLQLVNSILVDYPTYTAFMPATVAGYVSCVRDMMHLGT
jgi:hypothetical protein